MSPASAGGANTEPKKRKVLCPECNTEVELVDGEGECSNCKLDVGWCLEKVRRDKAVRRLQEREEAENPDTEKKKKKRFSFS